MSGVDNKVFRVLTQNVWNNASVKAEDVVSQIVTTNSDVVILPELDNQERIKNFSANELLNKLNAIPDTKEYYGAGIIISRHEILKHSVVDGADIALIDLDDNGIESDGDIVVASAHLEYQHYASNLPRKHDSIFKGGEYEPLASDNLIMKLFDMLSDESLNQEKIQQIKAYIIEEILKDNVASGRPESIANIAKHIKNDFDGHPSFIAGDFNEPSHLDWGDDTADKYDHNGLSVPWNTSKILEQLGYIDSFREVHPDPNQVPGNTWVSYTDASKDGWISSADESDRIDFIHYKNSDSAVIQTTNSWVVGDDKYIVKGQPQKDMLSPFFDPDGHQFSDHKGVMTEFMISSPTSESDNTARIVGINDFPLDTTIA